MTPPLATSRETMRIAEKVLTILSEGGFTATYKFAILLGLIDLCLERTGRDGAPPQTLTTRQLARKVLEIYWPQTVEYQLTEAAGVEVGVLRQNASRAGTQAEILTRILRFRARHAPDPSAPLARVGSSRALTALLNFIEWKLIEMPLPRLQYLGQIEDRFLYDISWTRDDTLCRDSRRTIALRAGVGEYQRGRYGAFEYRITLLPGVGDTLVQMNGLLRPLIHRRWADMVARLNGLPEARLETFLFGVDRINTAPARAVLFDLEGDRCFYCEQRERSTDRLVVDHFIPWARHPDNGLHNLVLAHDRCNQNKSDHLAADAHVVRWGERLRPGTAGCDRLSEAARQINWENDPRRTLGSARGIYGRLPLDARLWLARRAFVPFTGDAMMALA